MSSTQPMHVYHKHRIAWHRPHHKFKVGLRKLNGDQKFHILTNVFFNALRGSGSSA